MSFDVHSWYSSLFQTSHRFGPSKVILRDSPSLTFPTARSEMFWRSWVMIVCWVCWVCYMSGRRRRLCRDLPQRMALGAAPRRPRERGTPPHGGRSPQQRRHT